MPTIELNDKTGWISIPADVKKVKIHFKNGDMEEKDLIDFLVLKPRVKKMITKIEY